MLRARTMLLMVPLVLALGTPAVLANQRPKDDTINHWVNDALQQDPRMESSQINVMTSEGIVTLSGQVQDLASRKYAVLEAEKINGVRGVIDKLTVQPSDRTDSDIANDVRARLWDSPAVNLRRLDVDVADGNVALRGSVANWSEKQEAALLASEVRGVRNVNNELTIQYTTQRPDDAIREDVVAAMQRDVYLVGLPINVTVHNGDVVLSGAVGSAYERERATSAAWVGNVKSVKNDLKVEWWENEGVRKKYPLPSDATVSKTVKDELYRDLRVEDPFRIDVDSTYGHVTLRGTVPTYYQKELADEDARDVVGVGWVTNDLTVKASWRNDEAIQRDIMARLNTDYLDSGQDLNVSVKDGAATLSGNTNTYEERSHAVHVASRVPGVTGVVDSINVNWFKRYTDAKLQERIQDRLRTHSATRWVADLIHVKVTDGTAYLSGDVNTWDEREDADRIAFTTDGVKAVDNRIKVEGVAYPWDEWHTAETGVRSYAFDLEVDPSS
jgi:osmotically-inducible protein OsmY